MSRRFFITKNIDVLEFEATREWGHQRHNHNFYELTYILEGNGYHVINGNTIKYKAGDLFFLTPEDEHEFVVDEPTTFGLIKFTEQFFLEKSTFTSSTYWKKSLETVIYHKNTTASGIIQCKNDRKPLFGLYELIKYEINSDRIYNRNVLTELFGALIIILSRNIRTCLNKDKSLERPKIDDVLTYVRQNILSKEKLSVKNLAEEFNMSSNYIGIYIRKNTGISIQKFVMDTKIKMAEQLLKNANLSINEIADKLGFVDASHFNRTFKNHLGQNPTAVRASRY